jgi:hypothetical protein
LVKTEFGISYRILKTIFEQTASKLKNKVGASPSSADRVKP